MRVLIIEDDRFLLDYLARILIQADYHIRTAENGALGLAYFQEARVDVVSTDLMMSFKDGLETITDLRRDFPQVKTLAISAASEAGPEGLLAEARACGARATLAKPFGRAALLAAVSQLPAH